MRRESATRSTGRSGIVLLVLCAWLSAACTSGDPVDEIQELHAQGQYADSLEPLRAILAERGDDPEIHFLYGVALRRDAQPEMALWALQRAAKHPDWAVPAGVEFAGAAVAARNWEIAIEAASAVLSVDPDNFEALTLRGTARLEGKIDLEAALDDLDRVVEIAPDDLPLQTLRISTLISLDKIEIAGEAIANLEEKGREASFDNEVLGHFCIMRAVFRSEMGELDQAEELFGDCIGKYPTHSVVLEQAVDFFDGLGEPERATQVIKAALERTPENGLYRTALSYRLRATGDFEGSEKLLKAGLTLGNQATIAGLWASLADHYVAVDDLQSAAESYQRAFELFPEPSPMQILTLADIHARAGQHNEALEIAQQLENDAYRGLIEARVHLNEGRPAQALARLDEILPDWPDNPGARYYAARAAEQVGDFNRAIAEYRQSIRSNAAFTEAGLRLARIHHAEGALGPAWIAASHHQDAHPHDSAGTRLLLELARQQPSAARMQALTASRRGKPDWALVVSVQADEIARQHGPEAAIKLIESAGDIENDSPEDAPALRSLVQYLLAAGQNDTAASRVESALSAHPESADFHEIQGMLQAQRGDPPDAVQTSLERALEIDPKHARALRALADLLADAGDVDRALSLYRRSADADPHDPAPLRQAISLAARSDRQEAYFEALDALLREHPYDAQAAMQLAELLLRRSADDARALELARRARRFGGDPEATELLARIHRARGDETRARRARANLEAEEPETASPSAAP